MKAYSLDLRERIVRACDAGDRTRQTVADGFSVSTRFIRELLARRRATGSVAPLPHAGGFESRVDEAARGVLRDLVEAQPDATLDELRGRLRERTGVGVTVSRVGQVLQELKLPRKKSRTRRASRAGRT